MSIALRSVTRACADDRSNEITIRHHSWKAAFASALCLMACGGKPAATESNSATPAAEEEGSEDDDGDGPDDDESNGSQDDDSNGTGRDASRVTPKLDAGRSPTSMQAPGDSDPPATAQEPSSGQTTTMGSKEDLDDKVQFDWPEAKPTEGRRCQGGMYVGTWECTSLGLVPFNGDLVLNFVESMDGEFLELADGKLEGFVEFVGFQFIAKLQGRLDCTTLEFSAEATDGVYGSSDPNVDAAMPVGTFGGILTGALEPEDARIEGEWSLLSDVFVDCVGPWKASFVP